MYFVDPDTDLEAAAAESPFAKDAKLGMLFIGILDVDVDNVFDMQWSNLINW